VKADFKKTHIRIADFKNTMIARTLLYETPAKINVLETDYVLKTHELILAYILVLFIATYAYDDCLQKFIKLQDIAGIQKNSLITIDKDDYDHSYTINIYYLISAKYAKKTSFASIYEVPENVPKIKFKRYHLVNKPSFILSESTVLSILFVAGSYLELPYSNNKKLEHDSLKKVVTPTYYAKITSIKRQKIMHL